jgi:Kef-type K+ transport system membrane component KefB
MPRPDLVTATVPVAPVAPIGSHQLLVFLLQISLLLGLALLLGRLSVRLGMPALVGELSAGVLLGPSLLGKLAPGLSGWLLPQRPDQLHLLDAVGQLGVLLLVGIAGLYVDLAVIRRRGAPVAWVSAGGLLLPLGLGIGLGLLLPATLLPKPAERPAFALFLGVAMGVSAIPVIAKTLLEMRLLHRDIGQMIICAAAANDVAAWFLLSVASAMATTGLRASRVAGSVAALLATLAFVVFVGRPVAHRVLALSARAREPGVRIAAAVVLLMLLGAGTQALGLEAILGTFLGGIVIGSSRHLGADRLAPLRTFVVWVLAPIFFATAGLRMDLTALGRPSVLGVALVVLLAAIAGKFAGGYAGARAGGLDHWEGLALGAGLNARGVVEVIVAIVGLRLGVLGPELYTIVVLVAIATSLMAPPSLRYAIRRVPPGAEEREREREFLLELGGEKAQR